MKVKNFEDYNYAELVKLLHKKTVIILDGSILVIKDANFHFPLNKPVSGCDAGSDAVTVYLEGGEDDFRILVQRYPIISAASLVVAHTHRKVKLQSRPDTWREVFWGEEEKESFSNILDNGVDVETEVGRMLVELDRRFVQLWDKVVREAKCKASEFDGDILNDILSDDRTIPLLEDNEIEFKLKDDFKIYTLTEMPYMPKVEALDYTDIAKYSKQHTVTYGHSHCHPETCNCWNYILRWNHSGAAKGFDELSDIIDTLWRTDATWTGPAPADALVPIELNARLMTKVAIEGNLVFNALDLINLYLEDDEKYQDCAWVYDEEVNNKDYFLLGVKASGEKVLIGRLDKRKAVMSSHKLYA